MNHETDRLKTEGDREQKSPRQSDAPEKKARFNPLMFVYRFFFKKKQPAAGRDLPEDSYPLF